MILLLQPPTCWDNRHASGVHGFSEITKGLFFSSSSSFFFFFLWYWAWGLNSGLHLEPLHQPIFVTVFFEIGSHELFARAGFEPRSS
jgi:hypothetical protein